ncbi:uncharacterized protein LOC142802825 [Rhipicephalus microplus]|uniref:uncharacterized protein LOC142802825 n=1 Tax=Rhipicephalus microplus TaxID=6941 RepID=UPI003F6B1838
MKTTHARASPAAGARTSRAESLCACAEYGSVCARESASGAALCTAFRREGGGARLTCGSPVFASPRKPVCSIVARYSPFECPRNRGARTCAGFRKGWHFRGASQQHKRLPDPDESALLTSPLLSPFALERTTATTEEKATRRGLHYLNRRLRRRQHTPALLSVLFPARVSRTDERRKKKEKFSPDSASAATSPRVGG